MVMRPNADRIYNIIGAFILQLLHTDQKNWSVISWSLSMTPLIGQFRSLRELIGHLLAESYEWQLRAGEQFWSDRAFKRILGRATRQFRPYSGGYGRKDWVWSVKQLTI